MFTSLVWIESSYFVTPVNWKGRQKKDRCVFPQSVPRFPPRKLRWNLKKAPWENEEQKKRNGLPAVSFLECTSIPKVFWHIYFLRGFAFFFLAGFLNVARIIVLRQHFSLRRTPRSGRVQHFERWWGNQRGNWWRISHGERSHGERGIVIQTHQRFFLIEEMFQKFHFHEARVEMPKASFPVAVVHTWSYMLPTQRKKGCFSTLQLSKACSWCPTAVYSLTVFSHRAKRGSSRQWKAGHEVVQRQIQY